MRKYKYLNNDNAPKRDVAYNLRGIANKYIFQQSSMDISYLVCDTVDEFYTYYSKKQPSSRMHFEVINDEFSAQKFKLDIDGRIGDDKMEYLVKVIRRIFRRLTKAHKPDIIVYDISTSHHVVVTNFCFSAISCEMLANAVHEKMCKRYPIEASLIDTVVYKRLQMFRVEGSTKYAQRRWKYVAGTKELSPLDVFKQGLISYVDECYHIDGDKVVDVMLELGIYHPSQYGEKKKCSNITNIPREFIIRKVIGNLIVLDRIASSYCNMCKRVHDGDGAYMVGRKFFCRRFQQR